MYLFWGLVVWAIGGGFVWLCIIIVKNFSNILPIIIIGAIVIFIIYVLYKTGKTFHDDVVKRY